MNGLLNVEEKYQSGILIEKLENERVMRRTVPGNIPDPRTTENGSMPEACRLGVGA
jgi:hypothetical protein